MGCFTIARALLVRILFTAHGIFSIWRLHMVTRDAQYWYLTMALFGLAFETALTLYKKRGQEWKWFCPSVFFYLLCLVPTVWFLELNELEGRIKKEQEESAKEHAHNDTTEEGLEISTTALPTPEYDEFYLAYPEDEEEDPSEHLKKIFDEVIDSHDWVKLVEQFLLLILIIGRWMLPKGKLTHDQLSQLLLVYIGTAADIVEFFDAFKEKEVMTNRILCTVILAIWTWSIMQFTAINPEGLVEIFELCIRRLKTNKSCCCEQGNSTKQDQMVFTATKARKDQPGALFTPDPIRPGDSCCTPDVFGIIMSIFMQDGPFLVLRLLLIFKYNVVSYTNMFFTCKNTLVCALLLYRFVVIQLQRYQLLKQSEGGEAVRMAESSSRAQLFLNCSSTDQYYKYSTKIILKESNEDPNDAEVTYVVKRHMSLPTFVGVGDDSFDDVRTLYASDAGVVLPSELEDLLDRSNIIRSRDIAETSTGSYGATSRELVAAVRRASLLAAAQDSLETPVEMERQMLGSGSLCVDTGSETSLERVMNIVKVRRPRKKEKGITLSTALTKSIQAMNSALGLNLRGAAGNNISQNNKHAKHSLSLSVQNVA